MAKSKTGSNKYTVRFPPDQDKKLKSLASSTNLTISTIVRTSVSAMMENKFYLPRDLTVRLERVAELKKVQMEEMIVDILSTITSETEAIEETVKQELANEFINEYARQMRQFTKN